MAKNTSAPSKIKIEGCKVLHCQCSSPFQDKEYGIGNRLHNAAPSAFNKNGGWRCVVCKDSKPV